MKQLRFLGGILSLVVLVMACEEPPVVFTGPQPQGIRDSKRIARIYQGRFLCQSDSATVVVNATTIYKEKLYEGVSAEEDLKTMTGNHPDNPTMSLPCRDVFQSGQKDVQIHGPFEELKSAILEPHKSCWS